MRTSVSRQVQREKAAAAIVRRDSARGSSLAFHPRGVHRVELVRYSREKGSCRVAFDRNRRLRIISVTSHPASPNKAPEPTTMAVTPRAIVSVIEMKLRNPNRHAARGAPAMVVAHL